MLPGKVSPLGVVIMAKKYGATSRESLPSENEPLLIALILSGRLFPLLCVVIEEEGRFEALVEMILKKIPEGNRRRIPRPQTPENSRLP
ncbi:unnamed protein product [Allacma fusca]|uniref:Uncharacterized protein n=1 Tax=Allacma fusca TaxID=39272 RepID=A0A8J2JW92_9HEXA|nr:unnamed protein product [Allacma fusca]